MKSVVTVLIATYNSGRYLREAVQSVFRQTYKNWRLLIVDDASTDKSLQTIRPFLKDPRVKVIRNKRNLGQAKSLNRGLATVRTPYVVQLDADDWFLPHTLSVLVREARKQPPSVGVISGNIRVVYQSKAGKTVHTSIRKGRAFRDRYAFLKSNRSIWPRFYRTSALRKMGGWPTGGPYQGRYVEDLRILMRLIERYRFHWVNRVLYKHRRHNANQTLQKTRMGRTVKWIVNSALKRWGGRYKAVFTTNKWGYVSVARLLPASVRPKKAAAGENQSGQNESKVR